MTEKAQGAAERYSPTNDEVYAEVCRERGKASFYVSTNAVNDVMAAVRALTIRAALKAQPAPTEAQTESQKLAERLADLGVTNLGYTPGSDPTVSRERVLQEITKAVERIQFGEKGFFLSPAESQGEDSARLDYLDAWVVGNKNDGWDEFHFSFNVSGTAREQIDQDRARASAETRGVKS